MARDEHAGKAVRCPACKQTLVVPAAPAAPPPVPEITEENWPPRDRDREEDRDRGGRREAVRRRRDEDDDYDRGERREASRRRDEYEDDYDDYDDRPRRRARPGPVDTKTIVLLSIGIGLLVAVSVAMIPPVYTLSLSVSSKKSEDKERVAESNKQLSKLASELEWPGFISSWRGIIGLILSILLVGAAVTSLILLLTAGRKLADVFLVATSAAGAGWGVLIVLWCLGYVFKGFVMSESRSPQEGVTISARVWPGLGLWLALVFAGGVIGVFTPLIMRRGAMWGAIGLGAGGFLGLVLLLADARPWQNAMKEFEEEQKKGKKPDKPWFAPKKGGPFGSRKADPGVASRDLGKIQGNRWAGRSHFPEAWRVRGARCLSRNAKPTFIASRETSSLKPWPWPGKMRTS
jgi:hypothetical protein